MTSDTRDDWERHWRDYSGTAEQNPAQRYRRELVLSSLRVRGAGQAVRIVDVGSGQGDMAAALRARFPSAAILGLDLSQAGVEIARRKVPDARFEQRDLLVPGDPPRELRGWATHAVCSEVIEHLDDPVVLLRNARAYMDAGCRLIVTAPGGPMSAFDRHIGHRRHWRRGDIEGLLRAAGYMPEAVGGAGFPFFNLYRCLVILRGHRLISDVGAAPAGRGPWAAWVVMAAFGLLIRPQLNSSRWGWQMVASARAAGGLTAPIPTWSPPP